ncbi:hypothetical protein [Arthrobacter sp. NA-172]|uniref:hypothetical protein n=1 Tax=Arthrobacter sp. NA-172 TaxID=3367524 RepID=UPI003754A811
MTAVLPWATLFVCLALTAIRIPSAVRGENRMMFVLFASISLDILLSIEGPYLFIDGLLGGFNLCNLLLRFFLCGTFLLMGVKVARAFDSPSGERAIWGPLGLAVLTITAVLTACFFFVSDTRGSTVGLTGLTWGPSLEIYAALGRFYPGFVAASPGPGNMAIGAKLRSGPAAALFRDAAPGPWIADCFAAFSAHPGIEHLAPAAHQLFGCFGECPWFGGHLAVQGRCTPQYPSGNVIETVETNRTSSFTKPLCRGIIMNV